MNTVSEQINALISFKRAYNHLMFCWDGKRYRDDDTGVNLNDTEALDLYPFHRSFDELNVNQWTERTIDELKKRVERKDEPALSTKDVATLEIIMKQSEKDLRFLSTEEIEHLQQTIRCLLYTKEIKEFHKHLLDSMPNLPSDTPDDTYDMAWEKFYETDFVISFGDRSVVIKNEATVWQGIVDTLEEMIDYCL